MNGLTDRQRLVLDFIRRSVESRGYPPTLREIGAHMGIRSTNGANDHLRALERKGYLQRDYASSRGLRVLGEEAPKPERTTEANDVDPKQAAQLLFAIVAKSTPRQAATIVRAARSILGLRVAS